MQYKIHDFELLATCDNVVQIDSVLDELEVGSDVKQRTNALREFMGIEQSFSITDEFTPEQEYGLAKRQLIMLNGSKK